MKQVTWANHKGGQLVHQRTISPLASPKKVSRVKRSRPIASKNMSRILEKKHYAAFVKIKAELEKCQKEIVELQKKCEELSKEEKNMSRKLKFTFNGQNKAVLNRMKKINDAKKEKKTMLEEKKILLRQLKNKNRATTHAMRQSQYHS